MLERLIRWRETWHAGLRSAKQFQAAVVALLAWAAIGATPTFVAPALAATSHEFTETFGGSGTDALSDPSDVAVDNSSGPSVHDIYVADTANHRIEKFSPTGSFILMFGKEVNETKVKAAAPEAEQDICTAASGNTCQSGARSAAPGAFESPAFVAVDGSSGPSSGDVYVGDTGDNIVSKFDEEGQLVTAWGSGGQIEGSPSEAFGPLAGIAVDHNGSLFVFGIDEEMFRFESSGHFYTSFSTPKEYLSYGPQRGVAAYGIAIDSDDNLYKVDTPEVVAKITESGTILNLAPCREYWGCVFDQGPENAVGLTIDPSNDDLYVDQGGGYISHFMANCPIFRNPYTASCNPSDTFGGANLSNARGLSVDATSEVVYVAATGEDHIAVFSPYVLPEASLKETTNVTRTSLTLNGSIEPGTGNGSKVTTCQFEYGYDTSYSLGSLPCTPTTPYSSPTDVSVDLSGLEQGTRYHYRIEAANARGETFATPDAVVSPAQEPTIENVTSSNVTATEANLSAKINPNGVETTYHFEYGTTTSYGESTPPTAIGSGTSPVPIKVHLENLLRGLTYHFRLVTENAEGTNSSEDQSFGFQPAPCPNELLRQESGSGDLPDCRAYELVSPANAGDAVIFTSVGPNTGQVSNPSRLAFGGGWGLIPNVGEPANSVGDMYVATRTDNGWETKYIGLPSSVTYAMGGQPWAMRNENFSPMFWQTGVLANSSLSRLVDWNDGHPPWQGSYNGEDGLGSSEAPYVWNTTTGKLADRWPTNVEAIPGGEEFEGESAASADLTHYVFSANLGFAPGGIPGDIYDDNTVTDEINVASRGEDGSIIKGANPLQVSEEGSRVVMTVGGGLCSGVLQRSLNCGSGQLYVRANDAVTYEIAPGHVVRFLGMTADGSKIYISSNEQLNSEDTNTSNNIYMWSEAEPGKVTLISKANGSGGVNTDNCDATWTENCNAVPVDVTSQAASYAGLGGNGRSDSFIASATGDIYFYSPAQLDGQKGIEGGQNLYVYREGEVQFVTTLATDIRMDVSPDGDHMAFITTSQVTGYNNAGLPRCTPSLRKRVGSSATPVSRMVNRRRSKSTVLRTVYS